MSVASKQRSAACVLTILVGCGQLNHGLSISCFVLVSPVCAVVFTVVFMKILLPFRYSPCLARGGKLQ